jgi:hypothetical protein
VCPEWTRIEWLWGLDLNQRPLGYEGKSGQHSSQDEPSQTNNDNALTNDVVGTFWVISVALLHSRFIGFDRRPRPHADACLVILSLARARCRVDSLRVVRVLLGRGVPAPVCAASTTCCVLSQRASGEDWNTELTAVAKNASSDEFEQTFDDAVNLVGVQRTDPSPEPLD